MQTCRVQRDAGLGLPPAIIDGAHPRNLFLVQSVLPLSTYVVNTKDLRSTRCDSIYLG